MKKELPLVSIIVPNYNYANYLETCLESILNQTYENIEVIFRDNASADDSYEIALRYQKKMREKNIYMSCGLNRRNLGSAKNTGLCYSESEGDYVIYLSSDDAMEPTYIEKCVHIMENHTNIGMVMVHRKAMDKHGKITEEAPFYNKSCMIPKESQAAVFMMAGIAVPSQILMRKSTLEKVGVTKPLSMQVANDWLDNFMLSMFADVAYIKEPLCLYRTHTGNETTNSERNLVGIFEHYLLVNAFVWISESYHMTKRASRYSESVNKLAGMCLRYAIKMFQNHENEIAEKYLFLAPVFDKQILSNDTYTALMKCVSLEGKELECEIENICDRYHTKRTISYDPPEDAVEISLS